MELYKKMWQEFQNGQISLSEWKSFVINLMFSEEFIDKEVLVRMKNWS